MKIDRVMTFFRHRPWRLYSLGFVLLLILVAVPWWHWYRKSSEYFSAVEYLRKSGIEVLSMEHGNVNAARHSPLINYLAEWGIEPFPNWNVRNIVCISGSALTKSKIDAIGKVVTLRTVILEGDALRDEDLAFMPLLPVLENVSLQCPNFRGTGMTHFIREKPYNSLDFSKCNLDWSNVAKLTKPKSISARALYLNQMVLTEDAFKFIDKVIGLEELSLSGCTFGNNVWQRSLHEWRDVRLLNLSHTSIDASFATAAKGMSNLQSLDLSHCKIAKGTLQGLARLTTIRSMALNVAEVEAREICELIATAPQVKRLSFKDNLVTEQDIDGAMRARGNHKLRLNVGRDLYDGTPANKGYWTEARIKRLKSKYPQTLEIE